MKMICQSQVGGGGGNGLGRVWKTGMVSSCVCRDYILKPR